MSAYHTEMYTVAETASLPKQHYRITIYKYTKILLSTHQETN
jgi:hypothetical protein